MLRFIWVKKNNVFIITYFCFFSYLSHASSDLEDNIPSFSHYRYETACFFELNTKHKKLNKKTSVKIRKEAAERCMILKHNDYTNEMKGAGKDNRTKVSEQSSNSEEWGMHGLLKITFKKAKSRRSKNFLASGVRIDNMIALTAGHCLWMSETEHKTQYPKYNRHIDSAVFYPGYYKKIFKLRYKKVNVGCVIVNSNWFYSSDEGKDIGALYLQPIGEEDQFHDTASIIKFPAVNCIKSIRRMKGVDVIITGYPHEYNGRMYTIEAKIIDIDDNKIYYNVPTSGGQSGGAIHTHDRCLVGIHTTGRKVFTGVTSTTTVLGFPLLKQEEFTARNGGVYLSSGLVDKIQKWQKIFKHLHKGKKEKEDLVKGKYHAEKYKMRAYEYGENKDYWKAYCLALKALNNGISLEEDIDFKEFFIELEEILGFESVESN